MKSSERKTDKNGMPQPVFKIVYRDDFECRHDTGICHSVTMPCEVAEFMAEKYHFRSDDPLHQATWHAKPSRRSRSRR